MGDGHSWNWLSHKHLTLFVYVRKISKSLSNNKTISRNNLVLKPITKSKNTKWQSRLLVSIFGWKFADVFLTHINKVNKSLFTWLARLPRPISPWVHMRNYSPVSKMRKGRRSWGRVLERNSRNKAWRNAKLQLSRLSYEHKAKLSLVTGLMWRGLVWRVLIKLNWILVMKN